MLTLLDDDIELELLARSKEIRLVYELFQLGGGRGEDDFGILGCIPTPAVAGHSVSDIVDASGRNTASVVTNELRCKQRMFEHGVLLLGHTALKCIMEHQSYDAFANEGIIADVVHDAQLNKDLNVFIDMAKETSFADLVLGVILSRGRGGDDEEVIGHKPDEELRELLVNIDRDKGDNVVDDFHGIPPCILFGLCKPAKKKKKPAESRLKVT